MPAPSGQFDGGAGIDDPARPSGGNRYDRDVRPTEAGWRAGGMNRGGMGMSGGMGMNRGGMDRDRGWNLEGGDWGHNWGSGNMGTVVRLHASGSVSAAAAWLGTVISVAGRYWACVDVLDGSVVHELRLTVGKRGIDQGEIGAARIVIVGSVQTCVQTLWRGCRRRSRRGAAAHSENGR